MINSTEVQFCQVAPSERILLLPHCLRRVDTCKAKYSEWGLECQRCNPGCPVNLLRQAAIDAGYKGVCVAPGGSLALKYVLQHRPRAVVAVACDKELREGIQAVNENMQSQALPILIIPLSKDGCLNTEVDIKAALVKIRLCIDP